MPTTLLKPSEDQKCFTIYNTLCVVVVCVWLYCMFATIILSHTCNVIYYSKFTVRMYTEMFPKGGEMLSHDNSKPAFE